MCALAGHHTHTHLLHLMSKLKVIWMFRLCISLNVSVFRRLPVPLMEQINEPNSNIDNLTLFKCVCINKIQAESWRISNMQSCFSVSASCSYCFGLLSWPRNRTPKTTPVNVGVVLGFDSRGWAASTCPCPTSMPLILATTLGLFGTKEHPLPRCYCHSFCRFSLSYLSSLFTWVLLLKNSKTKKHN